MRVWIVNHYAARPTDGASTRHFDIGRALAHHDHHVAIFASSFGHFTGRDVLSGSLRLTKAQRVAGVTFRWIRTPSYRGSGLGRIANMLAFACLFPVVQLLHRRPDVIVGSTVHPFAAISALLVARTRRVPFVYEVRDVWPETLIDMGTMRRDSLQARLLSALQRRLCRGADHVVCLLPGAVDHLAPLARPGTPVSWLPNGVDLSAPEEPVPAAIADIVAAAREGGAFVLGYLGSMGPANGLETLVEAMAIVEARAPGAVRCVLVGDGPGREHLAAAALAAGPSAICFGPRIDKASVRPFLRSVDAAVVVLLDLPVYRFGISLNKLFDYMGAARPVVLASAAANNPIADAGAGLTARPGDAMALADAIVEMARMAPADREAMGAQGLAWVREHNDMFVLGGRFEAILKSVVQHGPQTKD